MAPQLTVFYDGFCPVCSRGVAAYQRLNASVGGSSTTSAILWRDLAGRVDVLQDESFTLEQALQLLHVKDELGQLHVGLAAHVVLWQHVPVWRWLSTLLRNSPTLYRLSDLAYLFFTRHRPGLKRRAKAR
jgi:predicted DCC family thiol-disulfide oxidoreductase YuxK